MVENKYEILNLIDLKWTDNNLVDTDIANKYKGLSSYTIKCNEYLEVISHKYHKNDTLSIDLTNFDLTKYNSLILTVKGDGVLKLSIDSLNRLTSHRNMIEYSLVPFLDTVIFKLDFDGYDKFTESIQRIDLIFGSDVNEKEIDLDKTPSVHAKLDSSIITKFEFTTESFSEEDVFNEKGDVVLKETIDKYPDTINFLEFFKNIETPSYDVCYQDGILSVMSSMAKDVWSYISVRLAGYFKVYKKVVAVVKGDAGVKVKFKLSGSSIKTIETGKAKNNNISDPVLTGDLQKIEWYISEENLTDGAEMDFFIFLEPGLVGSKKKMEIFELYFSK